jgi:hypothetical protein
MKKKAENVAEGGGTSVVVCFRATTIVISGEELELRINS